MKIPRGVQLIECESIDFAGKDVIVVREWADFLWLLGAGNTLFKLKNSLYIITEAVAYVFRNANGGEKSV